MDKRNPNEDFVEYKKRLREQNKIIDDYLKGVMFWPSSYSGTWCKTKDLPLPPRREFTL